MSKVFLVVLAVTALLTWVLPVAASEIGPIYPEYASDFGPIHPR